MFPALSIAEAIVAVVPGVEISIAGKEESLESRIFSSRNYPFYPVRSGQVRGKGIRMCASLVEVAGGVIESMRLLRKIRPDLVIGVGGYVSLPVGIASALMRTKLVLHEQNSVPGSTNRFLSKFAVRVFTGFKEAGKVFGEQKAVFTGNPLRYDLVKRAITQRAMKSDLSNILILGGSAGATALNDLALTLVTVVKEKRLPFRIYHQTGEKNFEKIKEKYNGLEDLVEFFPFSERIGEYYEKADFAIARAGALTVSEIACFSIPAILVPYPYAADSHQEMNAREFADAGCGIYIKEEDLDVEKVLNFIRDLSSDRAKYEEMREQGKRFARPFAADEIARGCVDLL